METSGRAQITNDALPRMDRVGWNAVGRKRKKEKKKKGSQVFSKGDDAILVWIGLNGSD
jgi:hypothetical protein